MRNRQLISANIKEAKDELESILADLAANADYSEGEFRIALEHAYHDLNFAWHIRNIEPERVRECSQSDFQQWSKYPADEISEYE